MTPAEMLRRMTSAEIGEYMALDRLEGPSGELRMDQRFAMLASLLANTFRGKKDKPVRMDKFMLHGQRAERWKTAKQKGKDLSRQLRALFTRET